MNRSGSRLLFAGQSAVAGLSLAFIIVSFRPDWIRPAAGPAESGFAAAVAASAPAAANIFTELEHTNTLSA
jgi:hypothetical protein